jgi:hypothetical protein
LGRFSDPDLIKAELPNLSGYWPQNGINFFKKVIMIFRLSLQYNFGLIIWLTLFFLISALIPAGRAATPGGALDPPTGQPAGAPARGQGITGKMSMEEIAKELNNPVTKLWLLSMQNETFLIKGIPSNSYRGMNLFNFQPVMSVPLGENWNLINRPIVQILSLPYIRSVRINKATGSMTLNWDRTSGIGDFRFMSLLSPNTKGKFVWGLGPTWIFPTGSTQALGAGKYQMGSAAVAAYLGDKWILEPSCSSGGRSPVTGTARTPIRWSSSILSNTVCPAYGRWA